MSKFTGNIGPEEEDGLGWEGLLPNKDELSPPSGGSTAGDDTRRMDWLEHFIFTNRENLDSAWCRANFASLRDAIDDCLTRGR